MRTVSFEISELDLMEGKELRGDGVTLTVHPVFFHANKRSVNSHGRNVYLLKREDVESVRGAWGAEYLPGYAVGGGPGAEPYCRGCGEFVTASHAVIFCRIHFFPRSVRGYLHALETDCTHHVETAEHRTQRLERQKEETKARAQERNEREGQWKREWKEREVRNQKRCTEFLREQLKDGPKLNQELYKLVRRLPDSGRNATEMLREAAKKMRVVIQPKAGGRTSEKVWSLKAAA